MGRRAGPRPALREGTTEAPTFSLLAPILHIAEATERQTVRVAAQPSPTIGQLHQLHRNLRRLRGALRLVDRALSKSRRPVAQEAYRRLGRLARLVGDVRDLDVGLTHLPPITRGRAGAALTPEAIAVRRRMQEEARTGRSLLGAFLRSEIDRGLFRTTREVIDSAGAALSGLPAPRLLRLSVAEAAKRTERARRRAARRAGGERLHRLRIELRRLRHLVELGQEAAPAEPRRFPASLVELQNDLGALHDLERLRAIVRNFGPDALASPWAERKLAERRARRGALSVRIRRSPVRSAIAAFA